MLSLAHLGSFKGICEVNTNLVEQFKADSIAKRPKIDFTTIRKIAIEAPANTELTINDVDITMPSTGILEFGLDYVQIHTLIFKSVVEVNIIYLY